MVFRKSDLYTATIRYNTLSREMFFLNIGYDNGGVIFMIDEKGYRFSVEDYELGSFQLIGYDINYADFSQQITDIKEFGDSVDLTYVKAFSKAKVNGKEIEVDHNKMINLVDKLFRITLSYVKTNLSSYNFSLDVDNITIYYTYEFRNPSLNSYWVYTPEYVYRVSNIVNTLVIFKKQSNYDEPKQVFQIYTDIRKYSRRILSKVVNLVLQSRIKTSDYEIELNGKNVTINNKYVKVEDSLVVDITDSIKRQIEYIISNVKDKLNALT